MLIDPEITEATPLANYMKIYSVTGKVVNMKGTTVPAPSVSLFQQIIQAAHHDLRIFLIHFHLGRAFIDIFRAVQNEIAKERADFTDGNSTVKVPIPDNAVYFYVVSGRGGGAKAAVSSCLHLLLHAVPCEDHIELCVRASAG